MISTLENLIRVFGQMEANGWDTSADLTWSFFFVDACKEKLQALYEELKDEGYALQGIYRSDDKRWTLNASKADCLTPEKLHRRNMAFNELADYCGVELYDGWDVEKIRAQNDFDRD